MRLKQFLVELILLAALPGILAAQEMKDVYTLEKSIKEALEKNWAMKTKKEKIHEANYAKKQAMAEFLPKLSTTYGYTRLDEVKSTDPIDLGIMTIPGSELNTHDNYQWKTTISQPLFTGFALLSSFELAKLGIDLSKIELELEKLDIALRVKESYFNILGADRAVEVASKAVESLESHVKVASSFYKVGMIPINDLLKAEVELANSQQNLVKAQNAARLARANFNVILSKPIHEIVQIEDILNYKPETGDFDVHLNSALKNRPEIRIFDINLLQTDQQKRLARSKYYPEMAVSYDYIKEGDHPDVAGSQFHDKGRWQVMAVCSWTFWEWGKTHYSVKEQESIKRQLIQSRAAFVDQIGLEIKQAVLELSQAEKNIPTTIKAVEQAEENLRVSQERYKAQVTTSTEVLDAQTLLTQARTNYYNALYDHNLAKAKLLRAIGEY